MRKNQLLLLLLYVFSAVTSALAQTPADSADNKPRKWYAPDGLTLQFAGNIGMFAGGANYSFAKDKVNAELLYGAVPKFDAEEMLHLLTLKGIYMPIRKVPLREKCSLTPLRLSLAVSYYFRDQVSTKWSKDYPDAYYWWVSSLRMTGAAGFAVNRSISNSKIKEVSLYTEAGTYDLIVTSAVKDKTLGAWDIISFSVGTRVGF